MKFFIEYNSDKEVYKLMKEQLKGKMYSGRVAGIFDLNIQLSLITDMELCLITQALYKATEEKHASISPLTWFKEAEINMANERHAEEDVEDFIIFEEMSKKPTANENEWIGYVSYGKIKRAWEQGFLKYNQDTQRTGKIVEMFGKTYVLPTIFKANVDRITKSMVNRRYHTNMLTFNITNTPTHKKVYDAETRTLKVYGGATEIAVIDGGHRNLAIIKAVDEKPELENEYIAVMIKNLRVSSAQEFIYQESLGVKQDVKTVSMVNDEDLVNRFCRNINNERRDNKLYNMIGLTVGDYNKTLIPLVKMIEAIRDNFGDVFERENSEEIEQLEKYIIEFFNIVISNNEEYYNGDIEELKDTYISYTSNFTVGLIKMASMLYKDNDWDTKVLQVLENIDWDIQNPEWKKNKVIAPKLTPVVKKKIYSFFQEMLSNDK